VYWYTYRDDASARLRTRTYAVAARTRGDNLHDRHIPELTSVLRRHARLIRIRDTSPYIRATRLQPFIAIRRYVICIKQRTLSNKKSYARNAN